MIEVTRLRQKCISLGDEVPELGEGGICIRFGIDGALHVCAETIGGAFAVARAVQGPVHSDVGVVVLRRDPPVLYSKVELVGAAVAVDMVPLWPGAAILVVADPAGGIPIGQVGFYPAG